MKILVGLKDGRVTWLSKTVTDQERQDMLDDGCDSIITIDGSDDIPDFKDKYKVEFKEVV